MQVETVEWTATGAERKGDGSVDHLVAFSLRDVVRMGFEARCVGPDGSRYLWHGESGLRVETRTGCSTLVTRAGCSTLVSDPNALPDSLRSPTRLGLAELERLNGGGI